MAGLSEVPTDELLSFHDYPTTHSTIVNADTYTSTQINISEPPSSFEPSNSETHKSNFDAENPNATTLKSFWTLEYYQQFFDVDTSDVMDRIIASVLPRRDNLIKNDIRRKPDIYGPFWISVTLVFTIAISGNIASYLQHANAQYHWKYDFHLVSYAATAIFLYIIIVPLSLWSLLKWSSDVNDLEGMEENLTPNALELICIYGYSLFIYIPVSILWSIQINWLQWLLVMVAAFLSGSVLLLTLLPSLRLSKYKPFFIVGITACHLLLAAGFMLYFFHVPQSTVVHHIVVAAQHVTNLAPKNHSSVA